MKINRNKLKLSKLFRNDKFLIVFAFVFSCILWFIFSQNSDEDTVTFVNDVPITMELSQEAKNEGFEIFSMGTETASVKISGNRITVGSIDRDDILVTATQTGAITSSNTYPLELKAKQNSGKTNYTIISVDPTFVNVYIDRRRSMEFDIQDKINYDFKVDETYYAGNPVYSTDKVTITGPETEVLKIESVVIEGEISGQLKSTAEIESEIKLYDAFGELIESDLLTISTKTVKVSLPVFPEKEIPIKASFTNVPSGIDIDQLVTVEPSSIIIAGQQTTIDNLESITLPSIDFSKIDPTKDNQFELDVIVPAECKNISNVTKAMVNIDFSGYSTKKITITDFEFKNVSENATAKATTTDIVITVAGPADYLESLTTENITATIDLANKGSDFIGSTEIPVDITLDDDRCWLYGSYFANVSVEKNSDNTSSSGT